MKREYAEYLYKIVKDETEGLDSVYGDFIVTLVGYVGLNILQEYRYLETCGVVNGRQLYVLS